MSDNRTRKPTLTDRYVYAVGRRVPRSQRAEIENEVRERIADQVDAWTAAAAGRDGGSTDAAERAVLTDLGDPDRLAATYLSKPLQLLGPMYYLVWSRLLRLLLAIVVPVVLVAVGISNGLHGDSAWGVVFGVIGVGIQTAVHLCFWTTLVFVILDRREEWFKVRRHSLDFTTWTVDQLPQLESERGDGMVGEAIGSTIALAFLIAFVVVQQFDPWLHAADGSAIPLIDPSLWSGYLPTMLGIGAVGTALAWAVRAQGRPAWWSAVLDTVLALGAGVPTLWLWMSGRLLNPSFVEAVNVGDSAETAVGIVIAIVLAYATVQGIVSVWRGLWAANRRGAK